jgi:hypothetical protein
MHLTIPKTVFILSVLFAIWTPSLSIAHNPETVNWQKDIDFMGEILPAKHPNLFFKTPEETFRKELAKLKTEIPELSKTEVIFKIQKILAQMGDDHTNVDFIPAIMQEGVLPFKFQWFPEGIFIMETTSYYKKALGKKLVAVNSIPTDSIYRNISGLLPAGNPSVLKQKIPFLMNFRAILNYGCSIEPGTGNSLSFTFEDDSNNRNYIVISGDKAPFMIQDHNKSLILEPETDKLPLFMQNPKELFWMEHLSQDSILYIQYNRCTSREVEEKWGSKELASRMPSFRSFAADIFDCLNQHKVSKVVIDLRFNVGGSSRQGTELAAAFGEWKKQNPDCKFFVITGKRTYSSAIINTIDFQQHTSAKIIGEETSGSPNHFGETRMLTLPSSGLQLIHSTKYFRLTENDGNTLVPDIEIPLMFEDYRRGMDRALETVKTY